MRVFESEEKTVFMLFHTRYPRKHIEGSKNAQLSQDFFYLAYF